MARQWHIDTPAALVIDGVRFTLQQVQWRSAPGEYLNSATIWTRATSQSTNGLNITKPLYLPEIYWRHYDDYGNAIITHGVVFKERTWQYYGTGGYRPGATPIDITTLSPYDPAELTGNVLKLTNLWTGSDVASMDELYFGTRKAEVFTGSLVYVGSQTAFQFHGLGVW
jgi:hypothetical protein